MEEIMLRKLFIIIALFSILSLSGCIVKALHPFYMDDDVIFDDIFLGQWFDQDSSHWEIFQYKGSKGFLKGDTLYPAYRVRFSEGELRDEFIVHMFSLNNITYLDFYPVMDSDKDKNTDLYSYHILPTHTLARFYKESDSLIYVKWFNEDWLKTLFEQRRIKIAHEKIDQGMNDKSYVLTASTEELRKFVLKYGNDPKAFKSSWEASAEDQDKEDVTKILRRADVVQN
jgi:hypothetical protein